jgi:hypothetical protein
MADCGAVCGNDGSPLGFSNEATGASEPLASEFASRRFPKAMIRQSHHPRAQRRIVEIRFRFNGYPVYSRRWADFSQE